MNSVPRFSGAALELNSDELLAALRATPVAQKAVSDKSAAIAARRKHLAAELERLERDAAKGYDDQQRAIVAAQEAVKAAEQALADARAKLGAATAARSNASHEYDRQREAIEVDLRATAHPEIDIFVKWASDEWYAAQRAPISIEADTVRNKITGRKVETRATNHGQIIARMNALRAAIAEAEDLRLAADQSSIPAQLDALLASIPVIA